MKFVRAGPGRHVDDTARQAAELGTHIVRLNLELLNCILRRNERSQIDIGDVHRGAIDVRGVLVGLAAANLIVAPGEWICARRGRAGLAAWHHARYQGNQAIYVAPV